MASRRRLWTAVLLAGTALELACSQANTATSTIGATGGTVSREEDGRGVRVEVPKGALRSERAIKLTRLPTAPPGAVGPAIELEPHGTIFDAPVAVRFQPKPEELAPGVHFGQLKVATLKDGAWELLPTRFPAPGVIEGETTHFSTFSLVSPCFVSGTGTVFPLTGCPTFNPRITSPSPLALRAWGGRVSVTIAIQAGSGAAASPLVISGLRQNWTYYLLRLATAIETPVSSDADGRVQFVADASSGERLVLMATPGTSVLSESICRFSWQSWDAATRTCTATSDITDTPLEIYSGGGDFTLDCAGHTIGRATTTSAIAVVLHGANIHLKNCNILNFDTGVDVGVDGAAITSTTLSSPASREGVAIRATGAAGLSLQGVTVSAVTTAVAAVDSPALRLSGSSLRTRGPALFAGGSSSLELNGIAVDGTDVGASEPTLIGALQFDTGTAAQIEGLSTTGPMTGFDAVVMAFSGAAVSVRNSHISRGRTGIRIDGPAPSEISGNTINGNLVGLELDGARDFVFHNNFFDNPLGSVRAFAQAAELSDTRANLPTFQQGNFWGRPCPGPLFVAGTDSNRSGVVDSYPYGSASAWTVGGTPGCNTTPPLAAPLLTSPAPGAVLTIGQPEFKGFAAPGALVEVIEGAVLLASSTAGPSGEFVASPSAALAEGTHTVFARQSLAGQSSPVSTPLSFVVDTIAPAAPTIDFPFGGLALADLAPAVRGRAEPQARISIYEAGALLTVATTDSSGIFATRLLGLPTGTHTISARATDVAGNESAPSNDVTFSIIAQGTTVVGVNGLLTVTSVTDFPDSFEPQAGELNTIQMTGTFSRQGGGGQNATFALRLERKVVSVATGANVQTAVVQAPVGTPGAQAPEAFSRGVGWDGRDTAGAFVADGDYVSLVVLSLIRTSSGSSQACLPGFPAGTCAVDTLAVYTTATVAGAPLIVRPPPAAPGSSIEVNAVAQQPVDSSVLVIPESAFLTALAAGNHSAPGSDAAYLAANVGGALNDQLAMGVVAPIVSSASPVAFSSKVFIVVKDPQLSPSGMLVEGRKTDLYVAGVNLQGTSPWVGVAPRVGATATRPPPSSDCCGKRTACSTAPDSPEPAPGGTCPPNGYCFDFRVDQTVQQQPDGVNVVLIDQVQVQGEPAPRTSYSCTAPLFQDCTQVDPVCDPEDFGPGAQGNRPDQTDGCAGDPVGQTLPKQCTIALYPDQLPSECGGRCPSCGDPYWNGSLDGYLPPMCLYVQTDPGSDVCQPKTKTQRDIENHQMVVALHTLHPECVNYVPTPGVSSGACCGAGCFCEEKTLGGRGRQTTKARVCTQCADGNCRQFTERIWFDSSVIGGSPAATPAGCGVLIPAEKEGEYPTLDLSECGETIVATAEQSPAFEPDLSDLKPKPGDKEDLTEEVGKPEDGSGKKGDPVLLANGSYDIRVTDLSFEGPARPLEFRRAYNSRGDDRSALGSNWIHNWDVRIVVLREGNVPAWAPVYCAGTRTTPTCLLLYEGDRGEQLFYYDAGSGLYLPRAGSTDTIAEMRPEGGWALRRANGDLLLFNSTGYLIKDVDRFGNAFTVEYEETRLGLLWDFYCRGTPTAKNCWALSWFLGEAPQPQLADEVWKLAATDFTRKVPPRPADLRPRLQTALSYFLELLGAGPNQFLEARKHMVVPLGDRRLRPLRVTDDIGRSLTFTYASPESLGCGSTDFACAEGVDFLASVSGSAGTLVAFGYGQPSAMEGINQERFLTSVKREDAPLPAELGVVPAPTRVVEYRYTWSGKSLEAWTGHARAVKSAYERYYGFNIGCRLAVPLACNKGTTTVITSGNVAGFGDARERDYISDVADNITQVTRCGAACGDAAADDLVEAETRYQTNPFDQSLQFDRVVRQRFGSSTAAAAPRPPPTPASDDAWTTSLPLMAFDWAPAGPDGFTERTDAFLPDEIKKEYPLENPRATKLVLPEVPQFIKNLENRLGGDGSGDRCSATNSIDKEKNLPGHRDEVAYYKTSPVAKHSESGDTRLRRTWLSCEMLAYAQLADPTHNELLSDLQPNLQTPETWDALDVRVLGGRERILADANRICAWTKVTDRDGDLRWYGLNYRGQVLVDAVRDRDGFVFTETLYNADGNISQQRRPTRNVHWDDTQGDTRFAWAGDRDEGAPSAMSSVRLPFWAARDNLVQVEEYPRGGQVLDVEESGSTASSFGRYRTISYEPFFNQPILVEEGKLTRRNPFRPVGFVAQLSTALAYDYQELNPSSPGDAPDSLLPAYGALYPFGYRAIPNIPFFNQDLNGDGLKGSSAPLNRPHEKARGALMRVVRSGGAESESWRFAWAPHGQPAFVAGPDGARSQYAYYPLQAPLGTDIPPSAATSSPDYRGYLAQAQTARFDSSYPHSAGPAPDPCPGLPGPYQWLLPDSCNRNDPSGELLARGLPLEMVRAIVDSARGTAADTQRTTSFNYSSLGEVRKTWVDTGETLATRDTDGRVKNYVDLLGNTTVNTFDGHARAFATELRAPDNKQLDYTERRFDEEGRVTGICRAREAGECRNFAQLSLGTGVVALYRYFPEGDLAHATDEVGLETAYTWDERKLLETATSERPGDSPPDKRGTKWEYDVDGQAVRVTHGVSPASPNGLQVEEFARDGLLRLVRYTDVRGFDWHLGHSGRDVLARYKQDTVSYSLAPGNRMWESTFEYDGLLRLSRRVDNGAAETRYQRTSGGRVHTLLRTGFGPTHFTWSATGELLWQQDAAGTQVVSTWRPTPHESGVATIRITPSGRLTTAAVSPLDAEGTPLAVRELAGGLERATQLIPDERGRVREVVAADGMRTKYLRNFLGWVTTLEEQTPAGFDKTIYGHDGRGRVTSVTDPANNPSGFTYNAFGQLKRRETKGTPDVAVAFAFDAAGRINERRSSESVVVYLRDDRGDLTIERLNSAWGPRLAERTFDELGRVRTATYFNPSLTSVAPEERAVTRTVEYDALSRVKLDALKVGSAPQRNVSSTWSVGAATSAWQRTVEYPDGASPGWVEGFDGAGRLASKVRRNGQASVNFGWVGELYTGREQFHGRQSPLREELRLDAFGLPIGFSYRALDFDRSGQPLDADYCGTPFSPTDCGGPVMDVSMLRDVIGRLVSVKEVPSHPVFDGAGNRLSFAHPKPWGGFAFDISSKLSRKWRHEGVSGDVNPSALATHFVTAADVQALAAGGGAVTPARLRQYQREAQVGATQSIEEVQSGIFPFRAARGPGHQLSSVTLNGQNSGTSHDGEGRLVVDGATRLLFDARGQLAEVHSGTGLVEAYTYDDSGRLAAVHLPNASREVTVSWDGAQAVAAYTPSGAVAWEASWGPGLDKLLEWKDGATGVVHLPLLDERNSVVATLDAASGRVTAKADFTPEGRLIRKDSAGAVLCDEEVSGALCPQLAGMPFGFTGAFTSQRTGLIYLRNRWYSPRLGQFLSHDALGFVDSFNLYAYAAFDPINLNDPWGLDSQSLAKRSPLSPGGIGDALGFVVGRGLASLRGGNAPLTRLLPPAPVQTVRPPSPAAVVVAAILLLLSHDNPTVLDRSPLSALPRGGAGSGSGTQPTPPPAPPGPAQPERTAEPPLPTAPGGAGQVPPVPPSAPTSGAEEPDDGSRRRPAELKISNKQLGRKFGEHKDPSRAGYRTHEEYRARAQEIFTSPKSKVTRYPADAPQFRGETHFELEGDLLRIDPQGEFRSLYPVGG